MSGGSASLPANPTPAYQPKNQGAADTGAYSGTTQLNTNPNASYNAAASTQAGSDLTTTANSLLPGVGQIMSTAFDPQQALFAQMYQQQQDQSNVTNAQNGVAGTPYGAGLVNQNNQNFDINWQNQQLQRQATGASAAGTLLGAAGQGATTGTQVGQSPVAFSNAQQQQQIADYFAYMSQGTSASNAATSAYSAEAQAAIDNQQLSNQSSAGLGSLFGSLAGDAMYAFA
jgi:hypothetical protein